jgi:hypothetical protein
MYRALIAIGLTATALAQSGCSVPQAESFKGLRQVPLRSVFEEDQAVLTNDSVQALLETTPATPENARLAVLRLDGYVGEFMWSRSIADETQKVNDNFLGKLAESKHVANAFLVPSMIQPSRISFPNIRATAARCRAHLLLLYSVSRESETRSKLFAPREVKASCVVEALLFDTLTGTVQYTASSTQGYEAVQNDEDWSFGETIRRAELEAVGKALSSIADDVVKYLDS